MKIGFDLRFLDDSLYAQFVEKLCKEILTSQTSYTHTLYTLKQHHNLDVGDHVSQCIINIPCGSLKEQTQLPSVYKKNDCDIMIFFTHHMPLRIQKPYIMWIEHLKSVYYQDFSNTLVKHWYLYRLERALNQAKKVICFDTHTHGELTERFDTKSENISVIPGFFPQLPTKSSTIDLKVNVRTKYHIKGDFIIYSGGNGIEKNTEKLLHISHRLHKKNISLEIIFLGEEIVKNVDLRHQVIEMGLEKSIHFISGMSPGEEQSLYQQARATIFPSLYESMVFELFEPLYYGSPLLLSNIDNISCMVGKNGHYFSAISLHSMEDTIKQFLTKKIEIPSYKSILETYSSKQTVAQFLDLIKNHE